MKYLRALGFLFGMLVLIFVFLIAVALAHRQGWLWWLHECT